MDKFLRQLIFKEFKAGKVSFTLLDMIFLTGITAAGCMMRYSLKSVVTGDFTYFFELWINAFKEGGYQAIIGDFYDYNPPYMVVLYLISILPVNPLTGIKAVSVLFDILAAGTAACIVMDMTKSKTRTLFAYGAVWTLPTIVANGSMWGQCDSVYVTFILLSVYFLWKEKPFWSMLLFSVAFGFKMQAVFILPAYLILWTKRKVRLVHFLTIPVVYFISLMPAVLAGKSLASAIGIYVAQGTKQTMLGYNWPGIYELIGVQPYYDFYGPAAMWFVVGILMCIMFYLACKQYTVNKSRMLDIFLYISLVTVYFLPYMHERYGYVAGIFAVIYGTLHIKKLYVPVIHVLASYAAYSACFNDRVVLPLWIYSFGMLFLVLDVGVYIFRYINNEENRVYIEEN